MSTVKESKQKIVFVEQGGMWEYPDWEIRLNEEISAISDSDECKCKHCSSIELKKHVNYPSGKFFYVPFWICPRVIVMKNEGGYNTTGLCLDCLLETVHEKNL